MQCELKILHSSIHILNKGPILKVSKCVILTVQYFILQYSSILEWLENINNFSKEIYYLFQITILTISIDILGKHFKKGET